jgi:hypothetical protein
VVLGYVAEEEEEGLEHEPVLVGYEQHNLLQDYFSFFWPYFFCFEVKMFIM